MHSDVPARRTERKRLLFVTPTDDDDSQHLLDVRLAHTWRIWMRKCLQIGIGTWRAPECSVAWWIFLFTACPWMVHRPPACALEACPCLRFFLSAWNKWSFIIQFDSEGDQTTSNIWMMFFPHTDQTCWDFSAVLSIGALKCYFFLKWTFLLGFRPSAKYMQTRVNSRNMRWVRAFNENSSAWQGTSQI